ncbi:hypothetical protein PIROE2DRAFT_12765 [Piromyces sp. E2]|nr:hypothetical protein PIROE2DRAFT_12765 [Piromyces sp. E2]|eukprot:OUM61271.1 hypothetical protein PIROE2DRAFT_12765 [Piromyces sp. E2]
MSRYFAFTIDNYNQEQELKLQTFAKKERVMHLLYGYEETPTTGTLHLQDETMCNVGVYRMNNLSNILSF